MLVCLFLKRFKVSEIYIFLQAVYDLVNMTREEVRKKFEQLEYLYLDTRRVGLFKIADNLVDTDSQSLCRYGVIYQSQ